jgi:hypothetical protein
VMYPPVTLLLDLQQPGTLRRLYDNPTVISRAPRFQHLHAIAARLSSRRPNRRSLRPGWQPSRPAAGCCDQL